MAKWSRAYIDTLPDSSFLVIMPGGEKSDGITEPKNLRKFPVKDENGAIDVDHVRDALSRIPQSDIPENMKSKATKKAEKLLQHYKTANSLEKALRFYLNTYTERPLAKATKPGQRWVTIKEGHLRGRHILIDEKGYIIGGAIPKAFQGHHIGKLKGIGTESNPYHDAFEHHELKAVHREFTDTHAAESKELHDLIHDTAKYLHAMHHEKHGGKDNIAMRVKAKGGIKTPQRGVHSYAEEYHESIPTGIKRLVGNSKGRPIDEIADELHMTASELIDRLANAEAKGKLGIKDFYRDAERVIDEMHGDGEVESRRQGLAELEKEIAKVEAAIKHKQHEKKYGAKLRNMRQRRQEQPKKLAAHFVSVAGRLLIKTSDEPQPRAVRYHVTAHADAILRNGFKPGKKKGVGGEGNRTDEVFTSEDPGYSYRLRDHMNALEKIRTATDPIGAAYEYVGADVFQDMQTEIGLYEDLFHRELTPAEKAMVIAVNAGGEFPELEPESFFKTDPAGIYQVVGVDVTHGRKRGESGHFGHEESWEPDTIKPFRLPEGTDVSSGPLRPYVPNMRKSEDNENEYKPSDRNAYKVPHHLQDRVIYIPVNRLRTPYQTDEATNPEKVRENAQKIREGIPLKPIEIGYDYDIHDGHHRWHAAQKVGHTHVPCIVSGRNERRVKAAEKRYRRVWKSQSAFVSQEGRLLMKKLPGHLQTMVAHGDAHWVTVTDENSPLHGRHLLIGGPRPAKGERADGPVLAGKGVPRHIVDKWNSGKQTSSSTPETSSTQREAPPEGIRDRINWWNKKFQDRDYTAQDVKDHHAWVTGHKEEITQMYRGLLDEHPDHKRKRKATKDDIAQKAYDRHHEKLAYAASDTMSYNPWGGDNAKADAIANVVNNLTQEDVDRHIGKEKAEAERDKKILENPETLHELRQKKYMTGGRLSPEEQERLDELEALERKKQNAEPETKKVAPVSAAVGGFDVSTTKHTKTGEDLWVAKPKQRLDRDDYNELNRKIKALGGYYSSYVKGFVFKEDPGEKLNGLLNGGAEVENHKASEEYQGNRAKAAADKLRGVADNMQSSIDAKRADRLTNTARRASMAASAEADADRMQHIQKVMRNIADAIESGEATHLDGITSRTHVETLESILKRAHWENDQKNGVGYEESRKRQPNAEDIRNVEYPKPHANTSALEWLIRSLDGAPGTKRAAQYLQSYIEKSKQAGKYYFNFEHGSRAYDEIQKLVNIGKTLPKAKSDADNVNDGLMESKRLQAMGIETSEQLRSALREYMQYRGASGISDEERKRREVRDLEQQSTRANIPGFFPTPKSIAHDMVERADIKPGMKVLEPSAGKGNIADAIRDNAPGADLDTVEYNHSLAQILEHKGHKVVGDDFLQHQGEYDRIIMNPPFEQGADIDHVRKAYELLKPGGKIVAIMSEGPFYRQDKKASEFRDWLHGLGGESEQMEEGSFKDSERSTGVRTRMVEITKPTNTGTAQHVEHNGEHTATDHESIMQQHGIPTIYAHESERPEGVNGPVVSAQRPLPGDHSWEGESRGNGRYYATGNPAEYGKAWRNLDASHVKFVNNDQVRDMVHDKLRSRGLDPSKVDYQKALEVLKMSHLHREVKKHAFMSVGGRLLLKRG